MLNMVRFFIRYLDSSGWLSRKLVVFGVYLLWVRCRVFFYLFFWKLLWFSYINVIILVCWFGFRFLMMVWNFVIELFFLLFVGFVSVFVLVLLLMGLLVFFGMVIVFRVWKVWVNFIKWYMVLLFIFNMVCFFIYIIGSWMFLI